MILFLRKYFFVFIIPAIVLVYSFLLKAAAGPYWLSMNFDPSYQYLLNGLYMVKGIPPGHIDHPGTPLQLLFWMMIRLLNIGHSIPDVVHRVLITPEFYLNSVHTVLTCLTFFTSVWLAMYVYQKTQDKIAALLTQWPACIFLVLKSFASADAVLPVVANVDPESLLISIVNLFNLCLLRLYFAKTLKEETKALWLLGFICGLGIATKINFFPLLATPLIILSWRKKGLFAAICTGSFMLWTLPIIQRYPLLWKWVVGLTMHTGAYDTGKEGLIDFSSYLMNWKGIIQGQWFFVITIFVVLIFSLWNSLKNRADKNSIFLLGSAVGIMLQFALVAKHPAMHYLLPGLGLFSVLFLFLYFHLSALTPHIKKAASAVVLIFVLTGMAQAWGYRTKLADLTADILTFHERAHAKYAGCIFLGYYRSSGQEAALAFGDGWKKPHGVEEELSVLYPHSFFFNIFGYTITNFKERVWANDLVSQAPAILFEGPAFDFSNGPYEVRLLERGTHENIYLLTGTTDKQAAVLFAKAQEFFEARNYAKALSLGLLAQELHYRPAGEIDNFVRVMAYLNKKAF